MRRTLGLLAGLPGRELPARFDDALRARLAEAPRQRTGAGSRWTRLASRLAGSLSRERYLHAPWPSPFRRLAPAGAVAAAGLGLLCWSLMPTLLPFRPGRSGPAYVKMVVQQHKLLNAGSDMNATVVGHNLGGDLLGDGDEE